MLGKIRLFSEKLLTPVYKWFVNIGISANILTITGFIISIVSSLLFYFRIPIQASLLIVLVGFFDAIDGGVARLTKKTSGFGATLDATIDRYTEFFLALGITMGGYVDFWLGMVTAFTMNISSYIRARAESTGGMKECSIGLIERPEKLLLLTFGGFLIPLINSSMIFIFSILLIFGQVTTFQRLNANWQHSKTIH